ncbi:MAG TPA: hypothetical protein VFB83_03350 [Propionibacteriaceae bacterium]|nr:hypothetical protein [Propionibacteriaceae bacterium]
MFVLLDNGAGPVLVERGRTGQPYLVLKISCRPVNQVQPLSDGPNTVVFDRIGAEWVAVDVS